MIRVEQLHIGYSHQTLVREINIELKPGMCIALLGKNGSGKSTLLKTIAGLIPPLKGQALLNNKPIQSYSRDEIATNIAFLPSRIEFPVHHTLESFVLLGLKSKQIFHRIFSSEDLKKAHTILKTMSLYTIKDQYVNTLSDGQKQRMALAQTLARGCTYLIMDEPLSFLDHESKLELIDYYIHLSKTEQKTILFSTHDQYYLEQKEIKQYYIQDGVLK